LQLDAVLRKVKLQSGHNPTQFAAFYCKLAAG
jgi:hypothetical protein